MKKWLTLPTLILILALLLGGCGETTQNTKPVVEEIPQEETIDVVNETEGKVESNEGTESKTETAVVEKTTEKPADPVKVSDTDSTTKPENTTESKTNTETKTTTKKEAPKQETSSQPKKEDAKPKAETPTPKPTEPPATKVTITVIGPKDVGTLINTTEASFKEGDTILDVLLQITKKQEMYVDYTGSGAMAYVVGIDNYYEFDYGPKSGWTCKLNGSTLTKSSDAIKVKEGDRIDWMYTEDYSNEK